MNPEPSEMQSTAVPTAYITPTFPGGATPGLGASVTADLDALRNDMEQARELAAEYQRQLAGKTNEIADMRQFFEKTQADFVHLQSSVMALRAERHRLGNEAMKAVAMEMKLKKAMAEREKAEHQSASLAAEVERMKCERRLLESELVQARLRAPAALEARFSALLRAMGMLRDDLFKDEKAAKPEASATGAQVAATVAVPMPAPVVLPSPTPLPATTPLPTPAPASRIVETEEQFIHISYRGDKTKEAIETIANEPLYNQRRR